MVDCVFLSPSPLLTGHPWIVDDRIAPDKPLDSAVLSRLKQFSAMNKLKKMALRVRKYCINFASKVTKILYTNVLLDMLSRWKLYISRLALRQSKLVCSAIAVYIHASSKIL